MSWNQKPNRLAGWFAGVNRACRVWAVAGLLSGTFLGSGCVVAGREGPLVEHPFAGVDLFTETQSQPPQKLFVARIDLKNPRVHLRVARGGADPDGEGPWETTLLQPTRIAVREHFDLVVNGDFFLANNVKDAEGKKAGYRAGQWGATVGAAVTDGVAWSFSTNARPCFVVKSDHRAAIEMRSHAQPGDWEVVGGNTLLVMGGKAVPHKEKPRHPRTVVGLSAEGTQLTILVVDGRKPGVATGMTYAELSEVMLRLGCTQALNLDGGGSSVLAVRDSAKGNMKIVNHPSDGSERAVADVLGLYVSP